MSRVGLVRDHARFYEGVFDRFGGAALAAELDIIDSTWPETELVVLRPDEEALDEAPPNPLSPAAGLPLFLRTLRSMRTILGSDEVWPELERHLVKPRRRLPFGRRARTG